MQNTTYQNGGYKYEAGARVCVAPGSLSGPATQAAFEVVGSYPVRAWQPVYRIRSLAGREERMVPENELKGALCAAE